MNKNNSMNWVLADNRYLRFFSFTLFYIAQGLPIGLISIALPAWLAERGATVGEIASFIAISGLPWGFKLVAGPLMDRFSFLPMGRRRPWVVGAQFVLLLSIVAMGFLPDPANQIVWLTWLAFLVNCGAAVQDVAVDGMAIDVLPVGERGRANAFMAFGQVAGYSGSAALSATALVMFGLKGATLLLAGGVLFIFVWAVLVRERSGERRLPWSSGEATGRSRELQAEDWKSILVNLRSVVFLPASIMLVLVTFCWRATDGFWLTVAPLIAVQELGYASTEYSNWNAIVGLAAATAGLLIGPVIDRRGSQWILSGALVLLATLYLITGLSGALWTEAWFPLTILIVQQFLIQALFIAFIAIHMNICWQKVSATQFAIYMAWANLARSIGAWMYGELQPYLETGGEFVVMAVFCIVGAGLVYLVNLPRHFETLEVLDGSGRPDEVPAVSPGR